MTEQRTNGGPVQSWGAFAIIVGLLAGISFNVAMVAKAITHQTAMEACLEFLKIGVDDPDICDSVTKKERKP